MKTAKRVGELIHIKFTMSDLNEFKTLLEKIKTIPGRVFVPNTKTWHAPLLATNIKFLMDLNFVLCGELSNFISDKEIKKIDVSIPEGFVLREYQEEGVNLIEFFNGRALIADEMGLGKTIESLAWCIQNKSSPILIIVPASVKIKWSREVQKWMEITPYVIYGGLKKDGIYDYSNEKIVIINYDLLCKHKEVLKKIAFQICIIDEVHLIGNNKKGKKIVKGKEKSVYKVQRTGAAIELLKKIKYVLALSGTPLNKKPMQLFTILNILKPKIFNSFWHFGQRYCDAKNNGFGWSFDGATNVRELNQLLKDTCMIRRLKSGVVKELPEKQHIIVPVEIDNRKEYNKADNDIIEYIRKTEGKEKADIAEKAYGLVRGAVLRELAVKGKINQVIEWITNFLGSGEKLVVVCKHHFAVDILFEAFASTPAGQGVRYDGRDSMTKKTIANDLFQNDPDTVIIIGNIKAMGVGIDLYAASNMCFVELGDNSVEMDQACDRIHRIGQTANNVIYWYMVAVDTIEERETVKMIDTKRKTFNMVLEGKVTKKELLLKNQIKEVE